MTDFECHIDYLYNPPPVEGFRFLAVKVDLVRKEE